MTTSTTVRIERRRRLWLAAVCALSITACEQAEELAGGVEILSPPPDLHGARAAVTSTRDATTGRAARGSEFARVGADAVNRMPAPDNTRPSNTNEVSSAPFDTATVAVPRAAERAPFLKDADRAFGSRAGCGEAVRLYATLPKPADLAGAPGSEWVTTQLRIAQCSMEMREWTRSLDALANVKSARPREWSATYFEGQVYCQIGQYERGTKTFRDLNGLMGTLGTSARQAVSLLSKFGAATCDRLDYESSRQPERDKDQLDLFLGEYEEFIRGAESLQARSGFPGEYARELSAALKSARDHSVKHSQP